MCTVWMPESSQGRETMPSNLPSYCLHLLSLPGQVTKLQQMSGHTVPFPPLGHPPSMVPGELPVELEAVSCALLVPCWALARAWESMSSPPISSPISLACHPTPESPCLWSPGVPVPPSPPPQ